MRYPTIDSWLLAKLKRINEEWDNYELDTGEEGTGKSVFVRITGRRLDHLMRTPEALVQLEKGGPWTPISRHWKPNFSVPPPFSLENICFGQDSFLKRLATLPDCGILVGDELEGHKRLAMHGHRQMLLDTTKEIRFLRHNVNICFPHPDQFESDLFRTRLKWWAHQDRRGHVVIRERPPGIITFDKDATMKVLVKWPKVASFSWNAVNDPWKDAYAAKKRRRHEERMAERLRALGVEPDAPVPVAAAKPAAPKRIPEAFFDQVLSELKK